jgi:hypothetical protein
VFFFPIPGIGLYKNMADQSNYSTEERIVMSTRVHERLNTGKTIHVLGDDFQTIFNKVAPPKMTMLRWERKLFNG